MLKTTLFRTELFIFNAILLSGCAQPDNTAKSADTAKPAIVVSDIMTKRGTVLAVNRAERMVTLRGEDGDKLGLELDERVKNFDQIEVGDKVTAQYHDATLIFVRSSTGAPAVDADHALLRSAGPGEKPGVAASRTSEVTSRVENIDHVNRLVTLRDPGGYMRTVKATPEVEGFDAVRKGDEVVVRHTEAIAIAVTE